MAPFEDSIQILGQAFIFLGSAVVVCCAAYRLICYRKISRQLSIIASLAIVPISAIIVAGVIEGNIDVNPMISSKEQLIGTYRSGAHSLKLNADGTFVASGLPLITSGTWSNDDWNITLSNTSLEHPRIVTRNGLLCIAPFYSGVDGPMGILLRKES